MVAAPFPVRIDPENRAFSLALGASLVFHAALLSIHFGVPEKIGHAAEQALDVILVNSRSAQKPENAQAKAQVNLDNGGQSDDEHRASTPLPPSLDRREGDSLVEARKRIADLEARQRQAMTQLVSRKLISQTSSRAGDSSYAPGMDGHADEESTQAAMVLAAEIARNVNEYNKRPRQRHIGARAEEYRFAQYIEDWRHRVEDVGNQYYPDAARGKIYGELVVTVTVQATGRIKEIIIDRPSGHQVLDDAVRRTLMKAAPFAAFPRDIARDTDEIVITRMWKFIPGDKLDTDAAPRFSIATSPASPTPPPKRP